MLAQFPGILALLLFVCCYSGADLLLKKPYSWVVVATFKNESSIIADWLEHYVHEGADHFYLIDNGSMDNYMHLVYRFPQERITIVRDSSPPRRTLQDKLMKKYITQHIITDADWVLVVDIDEYVYPLKPDVCIADVLVAQPANVNRIWLPWKIFGSSGHLVQPKEGVIAGFTKRKAVDCPMTGSMLGYGKSFTRVKDNLVLLTHVGGNGDSTMYFSNGSKILYGGNHSTTVLREKDVKMQDLQLNHYMFQSRDYYQKIKCSRGGGQSGKTGKYTMEFYDQNEPHANGMNDTGLMERSQSKDRAYKCTSKFANLGNASAGSINIVIFNNATVDSTKFTQLENVSVASTEFGNIGNASVDSIKNGLLAV